MTNTFHIKNFDRLQHYKDRSPPWIKLYNGLLDDYAFAHLPDASKAHLLAIGLLASRYSNKIPLDADWISKRINATSPIDLPGLIEAGFIVPDQDCSGLLASRLQIAIPEREGEGEVEAEKRDNNGLLFEDFFAAFPRKIGKRTAETAYIAAALKTDEDILIAGAKRYASTTRGFEEKYILSPAKWLDDERWTDGANGHAKHTAFTSPEEIEGQRRLKEKAYGKEN